MEVLANARVGSRSGMVPLSDDIPGRTILFGMVPGQLPPVDSREFDMRSNRLLLHAVEQFRSELDVFLSRYDSSRIAIVLGASNTGIDEAQRHVDRWLDVGAKPAEMDFSMIELGTQAEFLKKTLGVNGPAFTVSTACSSSAKAFASARRLLEVGVADAAIVGGVDGRCRFAMNGFHALGALAQGACRPLAPDRDGINLGEGVALFTLEREDMVEAKDGVWVRLAGVGESSDAYHATAPDPEGRGAEAAMRAAMDEAGLAPEDVAYVNLHGTGTQANDAMEMKAVARIFKDIKEFKVFNDFNDLTPLNDLKHPNDLTDPNDLNHLNHPNHHNDLTDLKDPNDLKDLNHLNHPKDLNHFNALRIESTKPMTGHCLGAAGAVEAAICWLYLSSGDIAGAALSNSFAFGGSNACVALVPEEVRQ